MPPPQCALTAAAVHPAALRAAPQAAAAPCGATPMRAGRAPRRGTVAVAAKLEYQVRPPACCLFQRRAHICSVPHANSRGRNSGSALLKLFVGFAMGRRAAREPCSLGSRQLPHTRSVPLVVVATQRAPLQERAAPQLAPGRAGPLAMGHLQACL